MLRRAGLEDVHMRAAVVALHDIHPYKRLPIQFATSLRKRSVDGDHELSCDPSMGAEGRPLTAGLGQTTAPDQGLEPTASSIRSSDAPVSGNGSG